MRISQEQYAAIKAACLGVLIKAPSLRQRYRDLGLSAERFRWDVLWASGYPVNSLYNAGLNDAHIDTALRKIFEDK
jgi:hypothetical protein